MEPFLELWCIPLAGRGSLPCPQALARCHSAEGKHPSPGPLATWAFTWGQLSKQWEITYFIYSNVTSTCDGALWRAAFKKFWILFLSHVRQLSWLIIGIHIFSPGYYCLGFMIWTSGYMIFVLHRHEQRVQHIHSNRISPHLPMRPEPHAPS